MPGCAGRERADGRRLRMKAPVDALPVRSTPAAGWLLFLFACAIGGRPVLLEGGETLPPPGVQQQAHEQQRQRLEMEQEQYRQQLPEAPPEEERALDLRLEGQRQQQQVLQQRQQQEAAVGRQRETQVPGAGSNAGRRGVFQQQQSARQRQQNIQLRNNRSTWPRR